LFISLVVEFFGWICVARYYFVPFLFNDTATTGIYTLSLHDALPISGGNYALSAGRALVKYAPHLSAKEIAEAALKIASDICVYTDRKSTRLNSSHVKISYAVFCLKKKKSSYIHNMKSNVTDNG